MSKNEAFTSAIEAFQPGGADAPILYSTTEMNEKGFKALLGRKIKWRSISGGIVICAIFIMAASLISVIFHGQSGSPTFAAYIPMFIVIFVYRTTLINVREDRLDFYFIDYKFGSKYVVYDSLSLPYDRIMNVKVRTGRFNTRFTFEFLNDDKKYKIKTTVPNKMRKAEEQAENLKYFHEVIKRKRFNSNLALT